MKTKVIIFDLDGTAIDSPKQKLPSEKLVKAIGQLEEEYYFCAATGRVWNFAKPVLQALHLVDPCIISAGTQICDPNTGKILWQKTLEKESLSKAIEILKEYPAYKLLYNDGTEDDYFNGGYSPKDFNVKEPVYFLEQVFIPDKIAEEIYKKLSNLSDISTVMVVAQKPGCRDIHVINKLATKEHSIGELLNIIRIKKEETIGIGDGYNDIHLFNAVNYKVAMGNAVSELKSLADEIIDSAQNEGMAKYLESLI